MSYTLTYAEKKEKFDEVVQQVISLQQTELGNSDSETISSFRMGPQC